MNPYSIFENFVHLDELVAMIIHQSELYMNQKGQPFSVSPEELKAFLGLNLVMGYHILPNLRDCWSTSPDLRVPYVSSVMPRNRFEEIRIALHFSDNQNNDPKKDRACKVRPLITHLNECFQAAREPSKYQSIDEHMIRFKGHNAMKQYIKNKPIKWGFKMWCRCDSSNGYLYEFELYQGRKENPEYGLGEGIVLSLSKSLEGLGCEVYIDNFFNSPKLQVELLSKRIFACGTCQSNRKNMPKHLKTDKEMKRGDMDYRSAEGISCVKWMDNRSVLMLSNFIPPTEKIKVSRRKAGTSERIQIDCPVVVKKYNSHMGGVDLMDQKKSYHEVDRRSKIKYYLRIFFDLFDLSLINACIIHNQIVSEGTPGKVLSGLEYRQEIARTLIGNFSSRNRNTPHPKSSVKVSLPTHEIEKEDVRRRCFICSREKKDIKTNTKCKTCNVFLCFTNNRNCFAKYHN